MINIYDFLNMKNASKIKAKIINKVLYLFY